MKSVVASLVLTSIFTFGCVAQQIAYEPNTTSVTDPKAVIYRVIEEQPGVHTPRQVEVVNDKFKVTMSGSGVFYSSGAVSFYDSGADTSVVYYDSIGTVELYSVRDFFTIQIKNESGKLMYQVVTYDLNKAKLFIDALHIMMNAS